MSQSRMSPSQQLENIVIQQIDANGGQLNAWVRIISKMRPGGYYFFPVRLMKKKYLVKEAVSVEFIKEMREADNELTLMQQWENKFPSLDGLSADEIIDIYKCLPPKNSIETLTERDIRRELNKLDTLLKNNIVFVCITPTVETPNTLTYELATEKYRIDDFKGKTQNDRVSVYLPRRVDFITTLSFTNMIGHLNKSYIFLKGYNDLPTSDHTADMSQGSSFDDPSIFNFDGLDLSQVVFPRNLADTSAITDSALDAILPSSYDSDSSSDSEPEVDFDKYFGEIRFLNGLQPGEKVQTVDDEFLHRAVEILRWGNNARNNCAFLAEAIVEAIKTKTLPKWPCDLRSVKRKEDRAILKEKKVRIVKEERKEERMEIDILGNESPKMKRFKITRYKKFTHFYGAAFCTMFGPGANIPGAVGLFYDWTQNPDHPVYAGVKVDLTKHRYTCVKCNEANRKLMELAASSPEGQNWGKVVIRYKNETYYHELAYYATKDRVVFIDGQGLNGITGEDNNSLFYDFMNSDYDFDDTCHEILFYLSYTPPAPHLTLNTTVVKVEPEEQDEPEEKYHNTRRMRP